MLWEKKRIVERKNEMQTGKERKVLIMWNNQTKLNLAILLMVAVFCMAGVSYAVPMGTAFTYQGGLNDAGEPADGLYDFEFSLYDDPDAGSQQGSTVTIEDANVVDGSFAVKVDFGPDIFTGDAQWLKIAVRPGDSTEPNDFTTLSPRMEVTPTPYAIYSETAGSVKDGVSWSEVSDRPAGLDDGDDVGITSESDPQVGSNTTNYIPKWNGSALVSGTVYDNGNVGIGTTNPGAKLEVAGQVKITGGNPGADKILTSDASGLANWQTLPASGMKRIIRGVTPTYGTSEVVKTVSFSPSIDPSKAITLVPSYTILTSATGNHAEPIVTELTSNSITIEISRHAGSFKVSFQIIEYY